MSNQKNLTSLDNEAFNQAEWKEIESKQHDWINTFNFEIYQNQNFSLDTSQNFCILLPPPNITGLLHLGHVWNVILQDFLIKWEKVINHKNVYWLPGFDHAGIATQIVLWRMIDEKKLNIQKNNKAKIEKLFLKGYNGEESYKTKTIKNITNQLKQFGLSLNFDKTYFTLNDDISKIVKKTFLKYFNEGIIYRSKKIIHWDPILKTAISDLEVKFVKQKTKLYYFKYYYETKKDFYLEIATTRPETIFADTALVCHPDNKKYFKYLNQKFLNPFTKKPIPLLADESVDIEFGTGVMKCTPGHDFVDFEIGKKYNLDLLVCLTKDAKLNHLCAQFQNMTIKEARIAIEKKYLHNLLTKIEDYENMISISSRSGAVIEPYLSSQYFIKIEKLVDIALKFQNNPKTKINFYPKKFEKVFFNWLNNCHDWCISRQLFIGHPIPLYFDKNDNIFLNDGSDRKKSNDVLDTWYSSSLLPLLFLNDDIKVGDSLSSVLVTGYDILFFWVIRMILQTTFLEKKIPFKNVYLHGLVRDENNIKMSKSNNNGINPIQELNIFSTDSLRLYFLEHSTLGNDLRYDRKAISLNSRFFSKIMNIFKWWEAMKSKFSNNLVLSKDQLFWKKEFLNKFENQFIIFFKTINHHYQKFQFHLLVETLKNFTYDILANQIILEIKNNPFLFHESDLKEYFQLFLIILFPFIPSIGSYLLNKEFNISPKDICKSPLISSFKTKRSLKTIFSDLITFELIWKINLLLADKNCKTILINILTDSDQTLMIKNYSLLHSQKITIKDKTLNEIDTNWSLYFKSTNIEIFAISKKVKSESLNAETLKSKIFALQQKIAKKNQLLTNDKLISKADKKFIEMLKSDLNKQKEELQVLVDQLNKLSKI
ncbi:valine--tRNA ligase [Mycoplasma sp. SG1]|uniref:valine--tRNA ligase n=1 Tax=Mycoplasma sp. SG1 TaxID=2810348 RepID=UPI0020252C63|nr:valine--tRNA ligase [Mycoplasma sp. SG1]URM53086.1 valine--tRNA ligase [Mycoplasma sp. SG1]